jgi:hypothetical protein
VIEARVEGKISETADPDGRIAPRPLQQITLDGSRTYPGSTSGSIANYDWSLVQKPADSSMVLEPGSDETTVTVMPRHRGTYIFELAARDDVGQQECRPARLQMDVTPAGQMYATLTWTTPGDSDPSDSRGSDLDLHLLHPKGTWNELPWDCYWDNPTPDWTMGAASAADPELLQDVVSGRGPERVETDRPQDGLTYRIGVDYFSDHGFGPLRATLRIWIEQRQVFVRKDVALKPGEFWEVAEIEWPTGTVVEIGDVSDGEMSGD